MSERYGFSLTTFSPSGKLVQIEYALNAVSAGAPSVGIKGERESTGFLLCFLLLSSVIIYSSRNNTQPNNNLAISYERCGLGHGEEAQDDAERRAQHKQDRADRQERRHGVQRHGTRLPAARQVRAQAQPAVRHHVQRGHTHRAARATRRRRHARVHSVRVSCSPHFYLFTT